MLIWMSANLGLEAKFTSKYNHAHIRDRLYAFLNYICGKLTRLQVHGPRLGHLMVHSGHNLPEAEDKKRENEVVRYSLQTSFDT